MNRATRAGAPPKGLETGTTSHVRRAGLAARVAVLGLAAAMTFFTSASAAVRRAESRLRAPAPADAAAAPLLDIASVGRLDAAQAPVPAASPASSVAGWQQWSRGPAVQARFRTGVESSEQVFTLTETPGYANAGAPLAVGLTVGQGLSILPPALAGPGFDLVSSEGVVGHVSMSVTGADGSELDAIVEPAESGARVVILDQDAVYPIEIATTLPSQTVLMSRGSALPRGFGEDALRQVPGDLGSSSVVQSANPNCDAIATDAGYYHSLVLMRDGTVKAAGYNAQGQIGNGTTNRAATPAAVSGLTGIVQVSANGYHSAALRNDGTVWVWGNNGNGQLGLGDTVNRTTPVQVPGLTNVRAIAAGFYHTMVLKNDGTVWGMGYNGYGALGNGTTTQANSPVQMSGITNGAGIAAGLYHTMVLRSDGTGAGTGYNVYGQLGNGTTTNSTTLVAVSGLTSIAQIGSGMYHSLAVKTDGTAWGWGYNVYGQLGNGTTTNSTTPVQMGSISGAAQIDGGYYHSVIRKADGTPWATGYNVYGQLGNGTTTNSSVPVMAVSLTGVTWLAAGAYHSMAVVGSTFALYGYGYNYYGQLGNGGGIDSPTPVNVQGITNAIGAAAGLYHSLAVKADGTVWAWGYNVYGQLGNGTTTNSPVPVQVTGLTGVVAVGAGYYHSLAVKSDGTVWAWGYNVYGQLGNGTTVSSSVPVQVSGITTAAASVDGGYYHSVVKMADGTARAWGYNAYGQLGNGTTTNSSVPVVVSGLSGVLGVDGGGYHSAAYKSDGTAWTWGYNVYGQLGNGTTTNASTPVQVSSLTGVNAISGGLYHTIANKSDGTAWSWGYNGYGQLGDGTTTTRTTPVQVAGITTATHAAAGGYHSMRRKSDSTVTTYGYNYYGQLGNGTYTDSYVPVTVTGLTTAINIAAGFYHSLAIKAGGSMVAWGYNTYGQLGNNGSTQSLTPSQADFGSSCASAPPAGCSAGPAINAACDGVALNGTVTNPGGLTLTIQWTSSCTGVTYMPSPNVLNPTVFFGSSCGVNCTMTLRVTDSAGGSCTSNVAVSVRDVTPPTLNGVPANVTVDCRAVPGMPVVTVADSCDPRPTVTANEVRTNGNCPGNYTLTRTFVGRDRCGNSTTRTQIVTVRDTTPPTLVANPNDSDCLYPPNHEYKCYPMSAFSPVTSDDCSLPVALRLWGCSSNEPDEGTGDGDFPNDCIVSPDRTTVCIRSERAGNLDDRIYLVKAVASDACGNATQPTTIATITVPHDDNEHPECSTPDSGIDKHF